MSRLIVLRLHPIEPINGADFTSYLTDLSITVSDLAMDAPTEVQVVPIGTADNLSPEVTACTFYKSGGLEHA